jgi:hypothetical protein
VTRLCVLALIDHEVLCREYESERSVVRYLSLTEMRTRRATSGAQATSTHECACATQDLESGMVTLVEPGLVAWK